MSHNQLHLRASSSISVMCLFIIVLPLSTELCHVLPPAFPYLYSVIKEAFALGSVCCVIWLEYFLCSPILSHTLFSIAQENSYVEERSFVKKKETEKPFPLSFFNLHLQASGLCFSCFCLHCFKRINHCFRELTFEKST